MTETQAKSEQHLNELERERELAKENSRVRELRKQEARRQETPRGSKYPSPATRRRYQEARRKVGYAVTNNKIDWSRLAKRTSFIWKFNTLQEATVWVWEESMRQIAKSNFTIAGRSNIVLKCTHHAFGVAMSDLLDDQRNAAVFIPRAIATVCLLRSGLRINETARQMCRDHTTIRNARDRVSFLFEGLKDASEFKNTDTVGSSPDRPKGGCLPAPIHDGASGLDQAPQS